MSDSPARASPAGLVSDALATAGLRRVQLAWTACATGNWVFFIALAVFAYDAGGTTAVAVAALARMLPAGLAAPFGGALADRHSRRDVLVWISTGRVAIVAVLTAAAGFGAPLGFVLFLAAIDTAVASCRRPAQAALLPSLAETPRQLAAANAVASGVDNAAFLAGSLVAGVLIAAAGPTTAFAATLALFVVAVAPVVALARDEVPEHRAEPDGRGGLGQLADGFRSVAAHPGLRLVVGVLGLSTLVEGTIDVLVVVVAIELLDLGGAGVGWLNSGWGAGGLLGGAVALSLLARGKLARGLVAGSLLVGLPLVVIAGVPELAVALAMLVTLGVGYALIEIAGHTLLQRLAPDDLLARVFAVFESSYWITTGIGAMLAPALVALLGARGALVLIGACLPLLVVLRWAPLARLEAGAEVPEAPFNLLRGLPVFAPLPLASLEDMARRVSAVPVDAGDVVIREGDRGDRFYVISAGVLDVSQGATPLRSMRAGEFFGEIALLRDVPRTATVTARTAGLLYALERDVFVTAVTGHRYSSRTVESVVTTRLAAG